MDQFVTVILGGDQGRAKHEAEAIPAVSDGDGVEPDVSSQPGEVAFGLCLAGVEAVVLMCVCVFSLQHFQSSRGARRHCASCALVTTPLPIKLPDFRLALMHS